MKSYFTNVIKRLLLSIVLLFITVSFIVEGLIRTFGYPIWWIITGNENILDSNEFYIIKFIDLADPAIGKFFDSII